jgi:hypothetical protein
MSEAGTMCEVHGMKSCSEDKSAGATDKEPRYNGKKKEGRQLITDRKLKESNGEKVKDEFKNFHDEFKSHPPHVQTKITSNLRKGMSYRKAIDTAKKLKEEQIEEREMTAADKKREEKLKSKYDDSGMKASMIKQYGDEKGKKVYFAYIRKKAMKSEQADTHMATPSGLVGDTGRV